MKTQTEDNEEDSRDMLQLCRDGFTALNAYKRSRALARNYWKDGKFDKMKAHQLYMFEHIDDLELVLRTIQKQVKQEKGIHLTDYRIRAIGN